MNVHQWEDVFSKKNFENCVGDGSKDVNEMLMIFLNMCV